MRCRYVVGGIVLLFALLSTFAFAGGNGKGKSVKAEGEITALSATSISVGGVTFVIDEGTKIIGGKFEDLYVGLKVSVHGFKQEDGSVIAKHIKFKAEKIRTKKVVGIVTAVAADGEGNVSAITLDGETTIDVKPGQLLAGRHGLPATVDCIIEGMQVRVRYKPYDDDAESDSAGLAKYVKVMGRISIKGAVDEATTVTIDLDSISVNTSTIYYDDITIVSGAAEGVEDPGELATGTSVQVLTNPLADGTFLANKVIVTNSEDGGGKPLLFNGEVSGVATEGGGVVSFTIGETVFLVNEDTEFNVKGYAGPFPEEEFVDGLNVVVKAQPDTEGNLTALWVRVILPIFKYCGETEAIGADTLTVLGQEITVTEYTEFKNFAADPASLADLAVGDMVEVKAILWIDDTLIASSIELCDDDLAHIRGEIESFATTADGATFVIGGVTVVVDSLTRIYNREGDLDISDLADGLTVDVWGTFDSGNLLAEKVKVN